MADKDRSNSYILNTGKEAISHLENQQSYIAKDSYEQLSKAGLKVGQTVWDVGCGVGSMTEYLAEIVGSTGHVYAMDVSQEQLDVVKERLAKKNITNVTLVLGDISTYDQTLYPKADLVYSRLLLMHLREPLDALKNMRKLLKDKGKIALQESIFSSAHASPPNKAYDRYIEMLSALGQSKGVDYNIGNKLLQLAVEVGFSNLDAYTLKFKIPINKQTKSNIIKRLNDIRPQVIEAKISDDKEIGKLLNDFNQMPEDDENAISAQSDQSYLIGTKN